MTCNSTVPRRSSLPYKCEGACSLTQAGEHEKPTVQHMMEAWVYLAKKYTHG